MQIVQQHFNFEFVDIVIIKKSNILAEDFFFFFLVSFKLIIRIDNSYLITF